MGANGYIAVVYTDVIIRHIEPPNRLGPVSNRHNGARERAQHCGEEDTVFGHLRRGELNLQLGGRVAARTAAVTGRAGGKPVPGDNRLLSHLGRSILIHIGPEGDRRPPAVVGHFCRVVKGGLADLKRFHGLVVQRADIVRFTVVVPRNDLDKLRLNV